MSRFKDALARFRRRSIGAEEAGELLGVSRRQFRRMCVRFEGQGLEGLRDKRLSLASPRRADAAEIGRMCGLCRDRYRDFTVKHFPEALTREHNTKLCCTVTRLALQSAELVQKATLRGKHRKKRERRPSPGMLCLQEDRQVGRDTCVSWHGSSLQIPQQAHRHHDVRATIRVHEYPDGRLAIFDGPRCLVRYPADAKTTPAPVQEAA